MALGGRGGTIVHNDHFNVEEGVSMVRTSTKGVGTDEKMLIDVVTTASNAQRQELKEKYKQSHGKVLLEDIKSETSGDFRHALEALLIPAEDFDAYCLHTATKGFGTDESTLIQILFTRTNEELQKIKAVYKKNHDKDLEKQVRDDTSGRFKRLCTSVLTASRNEDPFVDEELALADAERLYEAGENKCGTDEDAFNVVFAERSHEHIRRVNKIYSDKYGKDLKKVLGSEFSGDIEHGLKAILGYALDSVGYHAECIRKTMKGAGTDEKGLLRLIISRAEKDLEDIKEFFLVDGNSGGSLEKWIEDDVGGDFGKLLLAICRGNRH